MKQKKVKEEAYRASLSANAPNPHGNQEAPVAKHDAPLDGSLQEETESEEAIQKRKQLEMLQKKWVSGLITEPGAPPAVAEDFSILSGSKPEGTNPDTTPPENGGIQQGALGQASPPQPQVDMDELKGFIKNTIRLEIDRAVRELKREIDETSESSKKEILDELKMELERIRNEVELAQPRHKPKGIFDRF